MGGWCGATAADAIAMKTRMRLRSPIGGGVCLSEHNGKKCQKLCKGEVLPLDRSLLMGDFSIGSTIREDVWTTGKPQTPEAKKRV